MDEQTRTQVIDNAKYLRQVRPIDPEEIYEYVEGTPHPAVVRQILREEAPELGLVEREDGRFEPVEDEPLSLSFHGVDSLPETASRVLEDILVERFGAGWPDGESGARLRSAIRDFKHRYLHGATVTYDEVTALGYAIYHLPSYYAAVQYVLAELAAGEHLPKHLRILDVGAGVGGPALGVDSLVSEAALVEYHAVEPSDATTVLESILAETGRNFHWEVHEAHIEEFDSEDSYDVILCANVLSELDDPTAVVGDLLDTLADDGTIVALEPADRNTATGLREIERDVESEHGVTVYAPTVRLWPHETPESECWSFTRKPDLDVPAFQQRLDEGERSETERLRERDGAQANARPDDGRKGTRGETTRESEPGDGEFVNVDVQYAYSLLRTDGERAIDYRPDRSQVTSMAETERNVTDRVDYVAVKLSHDLTDGGNPLFLVGDGSEKLDHFAVLTESSVLNRDLETAEYGELLHIENVLVLWNDDEGAYNLVVDGETVVERVPG